MEDGNYEITHTSRYVLSRRLNFCAKIKPMVSRRKRRSKLKDAKFDSHCKRAEAIKPTKLIDEIKV